MEEQMRYKELDEKLGLENSASENFAEFLKPKIVMHSKYPSYRATKVKSENINEESINEAVNRAKYLVDKYFNDSVRKPINYAYMKQIHDIDLLGVHLKKDLALKLLKKCANFGTIEEINEKVNSKDESIYWYNYVGELLYHYYKNTSDFSIEEKKL